MHPAQAGLGLATAVRHCPDRAIDGLQWRGASFRLAGLFAPRAEFFPEISMRTVFANAATVRRDWFVVDATDKTLGRLASQVASRLRGKHKAAYTPNVDTGDHIVIINAGKIRVTGRKMTDKFYHHHTGYLGNLKSTTLEKLLNEHPERAIEFAVKGMLPKNPLGRKMFKKLHVFSGAEHPHAAQQPKALEI
jgi:large subunit ribosomal protein L13